MTRNNQLVLTGSLQFINKNQSFLKALEGEVNG